MHYVSYNGKISEECLIPLDQGFLYGYGVFETINIVKGQPVFFAEHMERLQKSALLVGLQLDPDCSRILADCEKMIQKNQLDSGALRVTLSKGTEQDNLLITARENNYGSAIYRQGVKICTSAYPRNEKSLLVRIKSNNYLENLLILNQSKSRGFNEAIFFNTSGYLAEGCMSNIFFVKNNIVHTPAEDCGLLSGILRNKVIALLKKHEMPVEEGQYTKEELMDADEVFITNSLMEIMPVSQVDDHSYLAGKKSLTRYLKKLYQQEYPINL